FAIDGITSFSVKPLRLITVTGIVVFIASLCMLLYTLISWMSGHAITGWTSTIASIWMIGGIQLLSLGVIGEYIGKIYNETKRRPRFIIERYLNENGDLPVVDGGGR
ncbi:MAG: glycosyltransferase, partial [Ruthenibacterium sp.]